MMLNKFRRAAQPQVSLLQGRNGLSEFKKVWSCKKGAETGEAFRCIMLQSELKKQGVDEEDTHT